jgi:hypothetical protein
VYHGVQRAEVRRHTSSYAEASSLRVAFFFKSFRNAELIEVIFRTMASFMVPRAITRSSVRYMPHSYFTKCLASHTTFDTIQGPVTKLFSVSCGV